MNKENALQLLRKAINNPHGEFREDQWEAIDLIVNQRKKLLVVERTGWGKSSVYFISTRILRMQGKGLTIIISPLLALMRNQIEAAERLGIKAQTINSTNFDDWVVIKNKVLNNQIDALLISPERLANERFMNEILRPIADNIGLFVVDEAHCISDWGHDFRPDYRRIVSILKFMPQGMPVLGTTATANDRVMADIKNQLGDFNFLKGTLTRISLILQNIYLNDQAERLAWLKENVPKLPGSGIIYTLTKRDARIVSDWLNHCGIDAAPYYSDVSDANFESTNEYREHLEDALYNNEIKVLVATSALGMGYDKPDLSFVIHYQAPDSIITYYQQVGRAGRAINKAYGILLSGKEDEDIHEYFRSSAFPPEARVKDILNKIEQEDGLSVPKLLQHLNYKKGQIEQVLKYLSVEEPSPIYKFGTQWKRTAVNYQMDTEKVERLTNQRWEEWNEVKNYVETKSCLMLFLQNALDDKNKTNCGKCANCLSANQLPIKIEFENLTKASTFIKQSEFDIEPRIQILGGALSTYGWSGNLPPKLRAETGKVLSRWGDAGWGKIVANDKHNNYFRDELVDAMVEMITKRWSPNPKPLWVTCIPSLRHSELVPNFAERLAKKLNIPFKPIIVKAKETTQQKLQENSFYQCKNLDGVFVIQGSVLNEPVLLVDDAIDSGWTLTVAAALLKTSGSGLVYPVALTSTSVN